MAKTVKKVAPDKKIDSKSEARKSWEMSKQYKIVLGSLLVLFSIALLLAFISFFIYGQQDQSAVNELTDRGDVVQNWLGKFGAFLADLIVYKGFGIASFLFVRLFLFVAVFLKDLFFFVVVGQITLDGTNCQTTNYHLKSQLK